MMKAYPPRTVCERPEGVTSEEGGRKMEGQIKEQDLVSDREAEAGWQSRSLQGLPERPVEQAILIVHPS